MHLYIDYITFGEYKLPILVSDRGLVYVGNISGQVELLILNKFKKQACYEIIQNTCVTRNYVNQLNQYFLGQIMTFDFSIDLLYGTAFQKEVWKALEEIPYGHTRSYSQIAQYLGKPKTVRPVATAIGTNPIAIVIPCHRVVGKNGNLTGYRGGLEMKRMLLALEADKIKKKEDGL